MFTPMEGSHRVPFILRWSGRIPADRDSDANVHEVGTFTTLLCFVSLDMSDDRPIDGGDQRGLFPGESESSAREGFPIYFGDKLYAAKWRNFNCTSSGRSTPQDPVLPMGTPAVFNLLTIRVKIRTRIWPPPMPG
jgi:hypothetical protein